MKTKFLDMLNDVEVVRKGHIAKFRVELNKLKENESHGLNDGQERSHNHQHPSNKVGVLSEFCIM